VIWDEWLQSSDLEKLIEALGGEVSDAKLRLFACACCRRVWHLLVDERSRRAVEVAERFADGGLSREELQRARQAARACVRGKAPHPCAAAAYAACQAAYSPEQRFLSREVAWGAADAASFRALEMGPEYYRLPDSTDVPTNPWGWPTTPLDQKYLLMVRHNDERVMGELRERKKAELRVQAALLRNIFGNSSRPVAVNAVWLLWNNGAVVELAQAILADRAFDRLPILADALEEAGCDNQDILSHCRGPESHVRGCWVVDLVLAKK
jgi:hypothetical protein